jgi:hypothetical protein
VVVTSIRTTPAVPAVAPQLAAPAPAAAHLGFWPPKDPLPRPCSYLVNKLAKKSLDHPERAWPLDGDIADARNKHVTNTYFEMKDGIDGDYNWFESDIRMQGGKPVAAHGTWNHHGFNMADWVKIGAASQRGLKLDFKESAAITPSVALLKQANVPEQRIILNIGVTPDAPSIMVKPSKLKDLRAQFPNVILNLSPSRDTYTPEMIDYCVKTANEVGGPIMFPLNAQYVTPEIVKGFKAGGKVALYNNPTQWDPGNIAAATAKFRSWGVDGMIDLRHIWHGDATTE